MNGHIFKKLVFDNIKACFLHLPVLITEKSSALRRRTTLSTQPFIYRLLVSDKLSTRPFIYHISVSGKLSLYLHSSKRKDKSQQSFPVKFSWQKCGNSLNSVNCHIITFSLSELTYMVLAPCSNHY